MFKKPNNNQKGFALLLGLAIVLGCCSFYSVKSWADMPAEVYEPAAPITTTVTVDGHPVWGGDCG